MTGLPASFRISLWAVAMVVILVGSAMPSGAQSCSGKCAYDPDAVKCVLSAFISHTCVSDDATCIEFPCIIGRFGSIAVAPTGQAARCTSSPRGGAAAQGPVVIQAIRLKARS